MVILDFEVFVEDWMLYFIDTDKKQGYYIINDKDKLQKFYDTYKDEIMVGYNINRYDRYILQAILSGFNPKEINDWIIVKDRQGWEFSSLLRNYPIICFDAMTLQRSLKRCEGSLGIRIMESSVPFDIDRKLTNRELKEVLEYCKYDVWATFEIFTQSGFYLAPADEFKASLGIIKEFNFPIHYLSKTKAQLGVSVLGGNYNNVEKFDDEFDIVNPTNLKLGKYEYVREWFLNPKNHWYNKTREGFVTPERNRLVTEIAGIEHIFAWGGVHGSKTGIFEGILMLCDFSSLYPNITVEYDFVSRNVPNAEKYRELLETRVALKAQNDPRQESYKLALNASYGQLKYPFSPIYDPRMANNVVVHGQLIALDLIEKIEDYGEIINSNTDGVLIKVHNKENEEIVKQIVKEVEERVRIDIDIEYFKGFILKDVNNYIAIRDNGKVICKGGYVKYMNPLEYDLNIINHAIREYYINGISARETIYKCNDLREFQIISNAGQKYKYAMYGDKPLMERVNRVFASTRPSDKGIFKLHKETGTKAKIEMTPEKCFIDNGDIRDKSIPNYLDREWYLSLAERRIEEFIK